MFTKQIVLKPATQDHIYTELCNRMEEQGVFVACGNCDDKWIMGKWDDEVDFLAWCVAMGMATPAEGYKMTKDRPETNCIECQGWYNSCSPDYYADYIDDPKHCQFFESKTAIRGKE